MFQNTMLFFKNIGHFCFVLFVAKFPRRCVPVGPGSPCSLQGAQAVPEHVECICFEPLSELCPPELSVVMENSYKSALFKGVATCGSSALKMGLV